MKLSERLTELAQSVDCCDLMDELILEAKNLERLVKEWNEVFLPLMEYGKSRTPLGKSITQEALEAWKERDTLQQQLTEANRRVDVMRDALADAITNCLWRSDNPVPLSKEESQRIFDKCAEAVGGVDAAIAISLAAEATATSKRGGE